ncbi:vacuolar protein sorting-associated protein VTA1 homolog [Watersipora subatra]|uniref:vacuolar protein sorting-associated protein VTA1 homolog n=1 Tax=Watersipora subatra TaxID=2589382 RepID=UPI00355BFD80
MASSMPPLPAHYKSLQHYLKTAQEHEQKYPVVSYYCRMYVLQTGMELDRSSPEAKAVLMYLMEQLEHMKAAMAGEEAIKSDTVAQAHVEHYALKLFAHADSEDRAARHNKNVVKAFYNASLLFEVLTVFGPLNEDIQKYKKYARYKSAYINKCLKAGMAPVPGPVDDEGQEMDIGNLSIASYMATRDHGGASGVDNASGGEPGGSSSSYQAPPAASGGGQAAAAASAGYEQPAADTSSDTIVDWDKATKFTKFAASSLTYEDKDGAVEYLRKALNVLTLGHE